MRPRSISISERCVTKTDDPVSMRVEIEKHRQAYDIVGLDRGMQNCYDVRLS